MNDVLFTIGSNGVFEEQRFFSLNFITYEALFSFGTFTYKQKILYSIFLSSHMYSTVHYLQRNKDEHYEKSNKFYKRC